MSDGSIVFDTKVDYSGLRDVQNEAQKASVSFGSIFSANIASDLLLDFGRQAVTMLKDVGKESIDLASDLTEVQNVVDTTFGDRSAQIYSWADAAAESFGMSSLTAQQFTGTLGAMLKSSGIAESALADMSTTVVGLAGDFASFYNLDVNTAFEKLRSGISGETEPLKQLGINMSVANLEAYALSQGITTAYSAMSQAEQVMLRYNYLLSVSADAQGDFSKTADSFANQTRILELSVENIKSAIGDELLPVATEIVTYVNDNLPEITDTAREIAGGVSDLTKFLFENRDAVFAAGTAAVTAVTAYKGFSVLDSVITNVGKYASALDGAAIAQEGLNLAEQANLFIAVGTAAIAAATAVAAYLDAHSTGGHRQESDAVKVIEEQLTDIRAQKAELEELADSDFSQAYQKAKGNIRAAEQQYSEAQDELSAQRIEFLKTYTDWVNYEREHANNALEVYDDALQTEREMKMKELAGLQEIRELREMFGDEFNWDFLGDGNGVLENLRLEVFETGNLVKQQKNIINEYENNGGEFVGLSAAEQIAESERRKAQSSSVAYTEYISQYRLQRENDAKTLKESWENLDHDYAMGVIASDEELLNRRLALLKVYGDESNKDQWQYYEAVKAQQKKADEDRIAAEKKANDEMLAEQKKAEKAADDERKKELKAQDDALKDSLKKTSDRYKALYDDLKKQQEDYRSALMGVGGNVFTIDEVEDENGNVTREFRIKDIDAQISKMREYHENIKQIKTEMDGGNFSSAALLSELTSLSPDDSAQMAEYIANMTESERQKLYALYNEKQTVADELSADMYAKDAQAVQDAFAEALELLGTDAYTAGQTAAEQWANGFSENIVEIMRGSALTMAVPLGASAGSAVSSAAASQNTSVQVTVTGGDITLDGDKVGEYSLGYSQNVTRQTGG